jgi:DNA transformation protein
MAQSKEFEAYIREKFETVDGVAFARFFGGLGLSYNEAQFAMAINNVLYFCVDDGSRQDYLDAGMQPFVYGREQRSVTVSRYFSVPEEVLDNPQTLREWVQAAIRAAHASPARKKKKKASA